MTPYTAAELGNFTVDLRTTVGGIPSNVVLGSVTVPGNSLPATGIVPMNANFVSFSLPANVDLSLGEVYSLVISSDTTEIAGPAGPYWWHGDFPDPYADGDAFTFDTRPGGAGVWELSDSDRGFRILSVPEPATVVLMGLGLAGLGFARRRRVNA